MTENTETNTTTTASCEPQTIIRVKQEKIDHEIENRLKCLDTAVAIKTETNDQSEDAASDSESSDKSEQDVKTAIAPVKSSNEILAELFGVFNAAPPEELLDDKNLLRRATTHKKIKKEKKKKHRKRKSDGECSDSDTNVTTENGKVKHKKKKKHKHKHKDDEKIKHKESSTSTSSTTSREKHKERTKEKSKERESNNAAPRSKDYEKSRSEKQRDRTKEKDERQRHLSPVVQKDSNSSSSSRKRQIDSKAIHDEDEPPSKSSRRAHSSDKERDRDRAHNSFYNGYHQRKDDKDKDIRQRSTSHKIKQESSSSWRRDAHSSDVSLSDEETYLREQKGHERRRHNDESSSSSRHAGNSFYRQTSSTSGGTSSRNERRHHASRQRGSRSRSRSRTPIDKKRLFEIARKNAINMVKNGKIPDSINMSQEAKEKLLRNWRFGARSVDDLTELCRKIANGSGSPELSSDEDSDVDKNGNAKAFHHPFQLKEREPIVLHIRNSTQLLPVRTKVDDQAKITMQFPVSSGQQHRNSEVWVPVDKKESLVPLPALPPAKQSTNIFKDITKNVFEKPIPQTEKQEPAFKPLNQATAVIDAGNTVVETTTADSQLQQIAIAAAATTAVAAIPATVASTPVQPQPHATFIPEVPIPSATETVCVTSESIFPTVKPPSMDVSSIITKRLNAIRRLQENPTDPEALKMMYNVQRDMSSWATSKHLPGQFTGSTGANVMKLHELNSGPQVWARRDQLTSTKPVSGGMGMALLQKMGWKPGEGLGPSKSGSVQPLLLDIKLDKRGLVSREDNCQQQQQRLAAQRKQRGGAGGSGGGGNAASAIAPLNIQDKHPVCVLNELTSKRKWTPPHYTLINENGQAHCRMFHFSVEVNGQVFTPANASNTKKEAKFMAAQLCLQSLGILPPSQPSQGAAPSSSSSMC